MAVAQRSSLGQRMHVPGSYENIPSCRADKDLDGRNRCITQSLSLKHHQHFIRDRFPGLFGAEVTTMQSFMWQDVTQVGTYIMQCFARMNAADT